MTSKTESRLQQLGSMCVKATQRHADPSCMRRPPELPHTLCGGLTNLLCCCPPARPACTGPTPQPQHKIMNITPKLKHPAGHEGKELPNCNKRNQRQAAAAGVNAGTCSTPARCVARLRLLTMFYGVGETPLTCPQCTCPNLSAATQGNQRH